MHVGHLRCQTERSDLNRTETRGEHSKQPRAPGPHVVWEVTCQCTSHDDWVAVGNNV